MALRDRVTLTTPITRTTLNGWYVEKEIRIDLSTRVVSGYIRFYDTAGAFVKSEPITGRITKNRRDNMVADLIADIVAQSPGLAGTVLVEDVSDVDDTVANP